MKISSRQAKCLLLGMLAVMLLAMTPAPRAEASLLKPQLTLKETLEKGLKCRLPSEFAFVKRVVYLVDQGILPEDLVYSTFIWARRNPNIPFPYFKQGLIVRAARIGITIQEH